MKNYLAVFTGSKAAMNQWNQMDEATRKQREEAGMQAWGQWMEQHKADIVDAGAPLGKTKRTTAGGIEDTSNNLAAYVKVQADSQEAAAKLFENHPHFTIFPGDGVEVMECLPMPTKH